MLIHRLSVVNCKLYLKLPVFPVLTIIVQHLIAPLAVSISQRILIREEPNMARRDVLGFLAVVFISFFSGSCVYAAAVNLPQTGQKGCYDKDGAPRSCAGTGEDGEIRAGLGWPDPRFTVSGDCVTDNLTGLMWTKDANRFGNRTWQQALDEANVLELCGYPDWRLPNINEFESLIHGGFMEELCGGSACSSPRAWLESMGFTNVSNQYLSSTSYVNNSSIWFVELYGGLVSYYGSKDGGYPVWPVRAASSRVWKTGQTTSFAAGDDGALKMGAAWPDPRFTVSGDCVTDNLTGLVWTKDANIFGELTWQQALDDAAGLDLCGHTDWRLPNRKELISLIDYSNYGLALQTGHPFLFTGVSGNYRYWSSTTSETLDRVFIVSFSYGYFDGELKNSTLYLWPVRGGSGACPGQTVRIKETDQRFDTVSSAYETADTDRTIEIQADMLLENLNLADNKIIALMGGYNCGFTTQSGYTTIVGAITIGGSGSVEADRMIIR